MEERDNMDKIFGADDVVAIDLNKFLQDGGLAEALANGFENGLRCSKK